MVGSSVVAGNIYGSDGFTGLVFGPNVQLAAIKIGGGFQYLGLEVGMPRFALPLSQAGKATA